MAQYILKRVLLLIPKVLILSFIIFAFLKLAPGDAVDFLIPPEIAATASPEKLNALREELGLNDGFFVQYFNWLKNMAQGNLGYSDVTGVSIRSILMARLPITFELMGLSLLFSTLFGTLLGYISAVKNNTLTDYSLTTFGMLGISLPEFFVALLLVFVFAISLHWLPTGGRMSSDTSRYMHLILPCAALVINLMASFMRYVRNAMQDTLNMDYVKTARSKGLSPVKVNVRHAFRNALIPIVTIVVSRISFLVTGAVAIETVFNFIGLGKLMVESVNMHDLPVLMMSTFLISSMTLVLTLVTDIIAALLDPRIRME